jgi:molybdopterin/thiamine biosynthesis adenylyltransferase
MRAGHLGSVLREMSAHGFKPNRQRGGTRSWTGEILCRHEKVRIEFRLSDWDFLDYPRIRVLSGVDIPSLTPHLDGNGELCYLQRGSIVLDRYQPAQAVAQCLQQAQQVLERIKFDPEYRRTDIQDEFSIHWLAGQSTAIYPVLMGTFKPDSKSTHYWLLRQGQFGHALLTDERSEVTAIARALGAEPPRETTCPCWLLESEILPAVPERMPATVKQLFSWLQTWDPALYRAINRILDTKADYLKASFASFAVKTPIGWLGFGFDLNHYFRKAALKRPNPGLYRQHLHGKGGSAGILRLFITDVSPSFVHSRNLTFPDLRDKRIKLIGCGAIGSYVAHALVRLGAGSGTGQLTFIDSGLLGPENLGRHVLGYPALFQLKANALREELLRHLPLARIEALPRNVQDVLDVFTADLIIDATGEQAVSEMLNERRLALKSRTPVLHAWILGNGEAVQALWTEGTKSACYRCLHMKSADAQVSDRFPVLNHLPERRQIGCTAFTPYAVSAPMYAASLVAEMITDWLQRGTASPRFRTRAAENADVKKVKNQDVEPLAGCPACRHGL